MSHTPIQTQTVPARLAGLIRSIAPAVALMMPLLGALGAQAETPYAPRTEWFPRDRTLNMSSFAYRDRNENGDYDLGDTPLAGINFVMLRDGERRMTAESNENGFANFPGSRTSPDAPIYELGPYTFEVLIPPGWQVTSRNASQTREFIDVSGAVMGGGLVAMMEPVGLSPPKAISGRGREGGPPPVVTGEGLDAHPTRAEPDGAFRVVVPHRGTYTLSSAPGSLAIEVAGYPVDIGTFRPHPGTARPTSTLTFDDISQSGIRKVPSGYGGLRWFNINAIRDNFARSSRGYINGAVSGHYMAYTSSGHPASIGRKEGFDFVSAYLTVAWPWAEGETAIFEYWRGDTKVAEDRVVLSSYTPVLYTPRMADVTEVRISTLHYWQMVIDDLAIAIDNDG